MTDTSRTRGQLSTGEGAAERILDALGGIPWEADAASFRFAYVSPRVEALLGYPRAAWLQPGFWRAHVHPDDVERVAAERLDRASHGQRRQVEYRVIAADGRTLWVRDTMTRSVAPDGTERLAGVMLAIAERTRTEEQLRETRERLRLVVDSAPIIVFTVDRGGTIRHSIGRGLRALGLGPDEAVGRSALELFGSLPVTEPSGTRTTFADVLGRVLQGDTVRGETMLGRVVHDTWFVPLRDADGQVSGLMGISTDITAHRLAEGRGRESDLRLRTVFERAHLGMAIIDPDGRLVEANSALVATLGYSADELRTMRFDQLTHPDDVEIDLVRFGELRAGTRDEYELEKRYVRRDGEIVWGRLVASAVRGADGRLRYVVGMVEDVTSRKHLEEQLLQAQKMEAIGRLAGGVAHDFNNLLTVISGYSDFIISDSAPDDPRVHDAREIRRAADRATLLTQQLLAFSRKQSVRREVLDLNAVLRDTGRMLERMIGGQVDLELRLAPGTGAVLLDAGQLQQVVMNLVVNARDAMPQGGRITIETDDRLVEHEEPAQPTPLAPGRYARIVVRDTGAGMSPEVINRAFEPFFTTKEAGKGTGLGLSTVYGIVTQSKGHLRLTSAPGAGTVVEILFPRVGRPPLGAAPEVPAGAPRGLETILLVEDDAMLRRLAVETLQRLGYRVLAAESGAEALRLGREYPGRIDLVVVDVVLPGLSGSAVVQRLEAIRAGLRVLYMSGHADETLSRYGVGEEHVSFLAKPFTAEQLARRLRELLDET